MMNVGDMVRVKDGGGYYEDGECTTCYWPESKNQVGIILEAHSLSRGFRVVKIMVLEEIAEFDPDALEVINESR